MANDIRQQVNQMPVTHFVLLGALMAAGYYFVLFTGGDKYRMQINSINSQRTQLEADIAKNQKVVEDLKRFQDEVNQISEQFQAAVEYLPSKSRVEDVLDQLYTLARTTGVKLSKVKPSGSEKQKFYEMLKVNIQVSGNYGNITSFLVEVSRLPRIININGVSLKLSTKKNLGSGGRLLDLTGVLVTYRYLEEGEAVK